MHAHKSQFIRKFTGKMPITIKCGTSEAKKTAQATQKKAAHATQTNGTSERLTDIGEEVPRRQECISCTLLF
jgi:hypothetical protein